MEKELEKLDLVIFKVTNSNLDDETKSYILKQLQKRAFELRNDISKVNQDVEIYKAK